MSDPAAGRKFQVINPPNLLKSKVFLNFCLMANQHLKLQENKKNPYGNYYKIGLHVLFLVEEELKPVNCNFFFLLSF